MEGDQGAPPRPLYEQPWATFARKKYPMVVIVLMGLAAGIVGSFLVLQFSLSKEAQDATGWLILTVLVLGVFGFLMLSHDELTRIRFAVFEEGFRPPFPSFRQFLRREAPYISFSRINRVKLKYYTRKGAKMLDEISIELRDGSRFAVEEKDVKQEGLEALLKSLDSYKERIALGEVPVPAPAELPHIVPPWIRKEMRREIFEITIILIAISLFLSLYTLIPGMLELSWRPLVPLIVLSIGVPILLAMMHHAWSRAKELTEERLKETQLASQTDERA